MTERADDVRIARATIWDAAMAVAVAALALVAVVGPWLVPRDPIAPDFCARLLPTSATHPLGTDWLGRDQLLPLIAGRRATLGLVLAISLGAPPRWASQSASLLRRWGVRAKRAAGARHRSGAAFPELVAALAIAALIRAGPANHVLALVLTGWICSARLPRGLALASPRETMWRSRAWRAYRA